MQERGACLSGLNYGNCQKRAYTIDTSKARFGRKTEIGDRTPNFRFWLRVLKNSLNGPNEVDP